MIEHKVLKIKYFEFLFYLFTAIGPIIVHEINIIIMLLIHLIYYILTQKITTRPY